MSILTVSMICYLQYSQDLLIVLWNPNKRQKKMMKVGVEQKPYKMRMIYYSLEIKTKQKKLNQKYLHKKEK